MRKLLLLLVVPFLFILLPSQSQAASIPPTAKCNTLLKKLTLTNIQQVDNPDVKAAVAKKLAENGCVSTEHIFVTKPVAPYTETCQKTATRLDRYYSTVRAITKNAPANITNYRGKIQTFKAQIKKLSKKLKKASKKKAKRVYKKKIRQAKKSLRFYQKKLAYVKQISTNSHWGVVLAIYQATSLRCFEIVDGDTLSAPTDSPAYKTLFENLEVLTWSANRTSADAEKYLAENPPAL